jgi:hypothetical protein
MCRVTPVTADTVVLCTIGWPSSDWSRRTDVLRLSGAVLSAVARGHDEDVAICASVQPGLRSRGYDAGRLSVRREAR